MLIPMEGSYKLALHPFLHMCNLVYDLWTLSVTHLQVTLGLCHNKFLSSDLKSGRMGKNQKNPLLFCEVAKLGHGLLNFGHDDLPC